METTKKLHFEKLTPSSNGDLRVYESAIDFIFENDDIRNVAISGAYGAGKSSILLSYQNKHNQDDDPQFLHISLAHFKHDTAATKVDNSDKPGETGDSEENILEGKILNQLLHQIPSDRIPQTNFRVKKSSGKKDTWKVTALLAVLVLACLHVFNFVDWTKFVVSLPFGCIRSILRITIRPYARLVSGILIFMCGCFFLYQVIKAQKNKNLFKRLNIQGNEIEIFEESKDSYFDKYLNEVLYLFENVDADVIVFEDMDRFEANRIFERLREVNTLVNIQRKKEGKAVLRFFYLLRDDIFISKDRTKFFDYIVPVIPVVDSSNSYDQFISHLKKNDLFEQFDESFLKGISLYVDDMRLLKNICNEFLIYFNRLNTTELDHNKMLALITYKNLFPRDFSELQLNRGFVFSLFDHKAEFVQEEIEALEKKMEELRKRITLSKDELANSKTELDIIFDKKRRSGYPYYGKLNETDQAEYDERLQAIEDKADSKRQSINNELSAIEDQLHAVKNAPLAQIITRKNIDRIFSLTTTNDTGIVTTSDEIKGSEYIDLVKYLIRNGYIDETYADYLTYFYENSLSRIDKMFLRSVSDRKAKPYTYDLNSPAKILQHLRPLDFDQEEILNFKLCDYLLGQKNTRVYLQHLIEQLQNNNEYAFVAQFFAWTQHAEQFVNTFNRQWPSLFADMHAEAMFDNYQEKRYSLYSLYHCDPDTIKAIDEDAVLSDYISNSRDYLEIENPQIEKIISGFMLLDVSFLSIDYKKSNKELFHAVYENDLYLLNFENLSMILIHVLGANGIEDVKHRSYSIITSNQTSPLSARIDEDFVSYFDILTEVCDGQILDDEEAAILLLNRTDIDVQQKQHYIECLKTQITRLEDLTDQAIWEAQMAHGMLLCSEQNIMAYFQYKKVIDNTLITFINNSECALDFSDDNTGFTENQRDHLWDHVIDCNALDNSKYMQMITTLGFHYDEFNVKGIDVSKLNILIDKDIVRMEPKTLMFIRKEYPMVLPHFIQKSINTYVDMMTPELYSHSELVALLEWDVSDIVKLKLLSFDDEPMSVQDKKYSVEVQMHILQNNLMEEDLEYLYSSYDQFPGEIKAIVEDLAVENIDQVISCIRNIPQSLRGLLLEHSNIATADKVELIIAMIPTISLHDTCRYLSSIGFSEYQRILESHSRPKFEIDELNTQLLDSFVEQKWIFDYLEDEAKEGYYRIRRKEPKKN